MKDIFSGNGGPDMFDVIDLNSYMSPNMGTFGSVGNDYVSPIGDIGDYLFKSNSSAAPSASPIAKPFDVKDTMMVSTTALMVGATVASGLVAGYLCYKSEYCSSLVSDTYESVYDAVSSYFE